MEKVRDESKKSKTTGEYNQFVLLPKFLEKILLIFLVWLADEFG
jgi:hypothetical protein